MVVSLGYSFDNPELMDLALTHRSCGSPNNERLEFFGDALLGMIISGELFVRFPDAAEGELSCLRADLVSGESLAILAVELGLPELIKLGPGERKGEGSQRKSILAGALESLIGAIYLDGGIEVCRTSVVEWFASRLSECAINEMPKDAKSRLQEYMQAHAEPLPVYRVVGTSGAAHAQQFEVECKVTLLPASVTAFASSRREAEKRAAEHALALLAVAR